MMIKKLTAQGLFLGVFDDATFEEGHFKMEDGDIAFLYTDGLVEAMNPDNELYGYDNLISKIIMFHGLSCNEMIDQIMEDVKSFAEEESLTMTLQYL